MARYEPILVTRTPAQSTGPTLTEIDEIIYKEKLSWSDELRGDGGFIAMSINPDGQSQAIKNALKDIAEVACEIWLYRDGSIVQAGPVIGVQPQGVTITLQTRALGYYLRYMRVTSDLVYTAQDQYTIAKGIVDHWQSKDYGNFGIDTSGIGTSGFNRTITYYADESPMALQIIEALGDNLDGFEFYVDPTTRDLILTGRRGSDKSSSVIIDDRAIASGRAFYSVVAGDYANHFIAVGADQDLTTPVVGTKTNTTAMQKFGRAAAAVSVDGVSVQAIIDDYAQTGLDLVDHIHFVPGNESIVPVLGADATDFDAGDTVTWEYDYGLGLHTLVRDVYKKVVNVDAMGQEKITVELL